MGDYAEGVPSVHPGEIIRHQYLEPYGMTPYRLAKGMGVPYTRVHALLAGKRAITAETALRLSAFLGQSAEWWTRLQDTYELREARRGLRAELSKIEAYQHSGPILDPDEEMPAVPHSDPEPALSR